MEKKTKMVLTVVAGALAIGLALSVGSCAMRSASTTDSQEPAAEQASGEEEQGKASNDASAYERACSKDWRSDKGSLQLSKGMLIEKDSDGNLHVMTIAGIEETDAGEQSMLALTGTDEENQKAVEWTLVFDEASGAATLSCDSFKVSKTYSENVSEGSVSVSGVDEAYLGMVGGDIDPLRDALESYIAKNLPQAASASFDGEAFIDFNEKTVSATFHADDSAKTILTVVYSNGAFTVSG